MTIGPGGKYLYVANFGGGTVTGFSIDAAGAPHVLGGASGTTAVDTGPASVIVEGSAERYVYTANFIGNSVSSLYLDPNTGNTHTGERTPFPGVAKATAVVSVKHHTI